MIVNIEKQDVCCSCYCDMKTKNGKFRYCYSCKNGKKMRQCNGRTKQNQQCKMETINRYCLYHRNLVYRDCKICYERHSYLPRNERLTPYYNVCYDCIDKYDEMVEKEWEEHVKKSDNQTKHEEYEEEEQEEKKAFEINKKPHKKMVKKIDKKIVKKTVKKSTMGKEPVIYQGCKLSFDSDDDEN